MRAANLGDDADTVAAMCGAIAGAYYGSSAISARWLEQLQQEARIREIALNLARGSAPPLPSGGSRDIL